MVLFVVLFAASILARPALARYQTGGFDLERLTAEAGTGPDPGTASPQARLKWAVETAVPVEWRESVPAVWTVGNAGRGHLALSYPDGRSILSARVMQRSGEEVLATVAHEMGHQVAFFLVSPILGLPPDGFYSVASGYSDIRESWADCVSRVWTGSTLRTLSEPSSCNSDRAAYVSGLLADPATLGATRRVVPPRIVVPPPPAPAPIEAIDAPVPEPIEAAPQNPVVPAPAFARPRLDDAPEVRPAPDLPTGGVPWAASLIALPLAMAGAGVWLVRKRSPALLAWATGSRGPK